MVVGGRDGMRPVETFAQRIQRARPDVAVDDSQGDQGQRREILAGRLGVVMRRRVPGAAPGGRTHTCTLSRGRNGCQGRKTAPPCRVSDEQYWWGPGFAAGETVFAERPSPLTISGLLSRRVRRIDRRCQKRNRRVRNSLRLCRSSLESVPHRLPMVLSSCWLETRTLLP